MSSAGTRTRALDVDDEEFVDADTESLLSLVAAGDQAAFAIIYQRFVPVIYGLAHHLLRDVALAEEVTQEVLLEVWQRANRFDPEAGTGRAWIRVLTHSRTVDRIRAVQRARVRDTHYNEGDSRRSTPSAADIVMGRLEEARVREALDVCTDVQRQAIELAYFGGHTYRQVSEMLGIPCCTAKTRIRDGMIRLRDHLAN